MRKVLPYSKDVSTLSGFLGERALLIIFAFLFGTLISSSLRVAENPGFGMIFVVVFQCFLVVLGLMAKFPQRMASGLTGQIFVHDRTPHGTSTIVMDVLVVIGTSGMMGTMAAQTGNHDSPSFSAWMLGAAAFILLMRGSLLNHKNELVLPADLAGTNANEG